MESDLLLFSGIVFWRLSLWRWHWHHINTTYKIRWYFEYAIDITIGILNSHYRNHTQTIAHISHRPSLFGTLYCVWLHRKVFISKLLKINQYTLCNQCCNFLLWFNDVIWSESFRDKCTKKFTAIGLYDFWSRPADRRQSVSEGLAC